VAAAAAGTVASAAAIKGNARAARLAAKVLIRGLLRRSLKGGSKVFQSPQWELEGARTHRAMTNDTDAVLIERVGEGDPDSFEELYRRFARPVMDMGVRYLSNNGSAEEAAQETFAAIWRSAHTFRRERGSGSAWLYTVARNAIFDRGRRRSKPAVELPADLPTSNHGPDERAEAAWVAWRVHSALAEIPERERTVLELAYWKGFSQAEIAEALDVPLGTVKSRTRMGLTRLAVLLGEVVT